MFEIDWMLSWTWGFNFAFKWWRGIFSIVIQKSPDNPFHSMLSEAESQPPFQRLSSSKLKAGQKLS